MLKATLHQLQDLGWRPEPVAPPGGGQRARRAGSPEGHAAEAVAAGAVSQRQQQQPREGCPDFSFARAARAEERAAANDSNAESPQPALRSCLQKQRLSCPGSPHGRPPPEGERDAERAKAVRRLKHNKISGASRGALERPPAARPHFAAYAEVYAPLVPATGTTPIRPGAHGASPGELPQEPRAPQSPAQGRPAPASAQQSPCAAAQLDVQVWDKVDSSTTDAGRAPVTAAAAGRAAPECPVETQPRAEAGAASLGLTPPRTSLREVPAGVFEVLARPGSRAAAPASRVQVQPPGRWAPGPVMARAMSQGRPFTEALAEDSWAGVAVDRLRTLSRMKSQGELASPPGRPRGVASCCAISAASDRLLAEVPSGVSSARLMPRRVTAEFGGKSVAAQWMVPEPVACGRKSRASSAHSLAPGEGVPAQVVLQTPRTIPVGPPTAAVGPASARGSSAIRHQSAPPDGGRQGAAAQPTVAPPAVGATPGAARPTGAIAPGPPPPTAPTAMLAVPSPATKVSLNRASLPGLALGLVGDKDRGTASPRQMSPPRGRPAVAAGGVTAPMYAPTGPQTVHVNYGPQTVHVNYAPPLGTLWPQPVSVVPVRPWGACNHC